jgi:hypothetical protein
MKRSMGPRHACRSPRSNRTQVLAFARASRARTWPSGRRRRPWLPWLPPPWLSWSLRGSDAGGGAGRDSQLSARAPGPAHAQLSNKLMS